MTPYGSGRHLLMTADAIGVWNYAAPLAQEMVKRGWVITLVTLGPAPRQEQFLPLLAYDDIELEFTNLELDWQDPQGDDRQRVLDYLGALDERLRPDVVHLNGYREACAGWRAPVLVAAHSCVGSWWQACRGAAPSDAGWQPYLADVAAGLAAADRWVAPTAAFRDTIEQLYSPPGPGEVIFNGIDSLPEAGAKEPFILAAGRLWDEARNIGVLPAIAGDLAWPVRIAGSIHQDNDTIGPERGVEWLGDLSQSHMRAAMAKAGVFVSPALYEPSGPTVLDAASRGCALVLSDIPSLRELWDGAALFVNQHDGDDIKRTLNALAGDADMRAGLQRAARTRAGRYGLTIMADQYELLYRDMLARPVHRPAKPSLVLTEAWA
jgi:glycosyltransferase involved in cell wall biosynthesis